MRDSYKIENLQAMLRHENARDEVHYGANLSHWHGDSMPLTIDAGGIEALIAWYSCHGTFLGNDDEIPPVFYDAAFIEKPIDEGLSREETMALACMVKGDMCMMTADSKGGQSNANGFINYEAAEKLSFEYSALEDYIGEILADINLESEDGRYEYVSPDGTHITFFLGRDV